MTNANLGASFEKFKRELTNYELWQAERFPDVLPAPYLFETEQNGEREAERFAEWSHDQYERQLHEYDDQYTHTRY